MSGRGNRKPLAQLVGGAGEICESGRPGPHSGDAVQVTGTCEHGHLIFADEDVPQLTVCTEHWRDLARSVEDGHPLQCCDCDHQCTMDFTARWPDGRLISLHAVPRPLLAGVQWEDVI